MKNHSLNTFMINPQRVFFAACLLAILPFSQAFGSEQEDVSGYLNFNLGSLESSEPAPTPTPYTGADRLQKITLALETLNVPLESAANFAGFPDASEVNYQSIIQHLETIDPEGGLRRYLDLQTDSISLFTDYFRGVMNPLLLAHRQDIQNTSANSDSGPLFDRLSQISEQVKSGKTLPLQGLKIAIDPGHMGPAPGKHPATGAATNWDLLSGKYVKIKKLKVSEGQLNLWTAQLVANELEALGAQVKLTRTRNGPVATKTFETFDPKPHINQYYYNSLDSWMNPYLAMNETDLVQQLSSSPRVKWIANPINRMQQLYISGEDLDARATLIDEFQPDITLDIHYDASKNGALQNTVNNVEAYVPGAFMAGETGSAQVRGMALRQLVEARRWNASVDLATSVTQSMANTLNLPLYSNGYPATVKVKDGVYARNLYITRRNRTGLIVYLECLHYDHVKEFSQMATLSKVSTYKGVAFRYPNRVQQVATGISAGILNYFRSL